MELKVVLHRCTTLILCDLARKTAGPGVSQVEPDGWALPNGLPREVENGTALLKATVSTKPNEK